MKKAEWVEKGRASHIGNLPPQQQINWLEAYAKSNDHQSRIQTTFYGDHDPFDVPISPCIECRSLNQRVWKPKEGKPAWRVICECGKTGDVGLFPRKAVFRWNKSMNSLPVSYQDSPLFQLNSLTKEAALIRIESIHNDLTLKIEIAKLKLQVGEQVASGYIARLVAYVDWIQYLEDLIKIRAKRKLTIML